MKYLTLAAAVALSMLASDAAFARGRRGCASCNSGCPGGVCSVTQAPVQKQASKGTQSPSDVSQQAQASEAAPAAQAEVATTSTQRTRRFAGLNRFGRRN